MIEYSMKALTAEELSFKVNHIQAAPNAKFEIKPMFSRQIRHANENPKMNIVVLECKIESTDDSPKPFNLVARFVGVFEVQNMNTDEDRRFFAINATETMFPFVRAAVANLTADALLHPLTLPVVSGATLFPDDRGGSQYTLNLDPKVVN